MAVVQNELTQAFFAEQLRAIDEWLAQRMTYLGASDIPAVLEIDEYRSGLQVYLSKVEETAPEDNEFLRAGRFNEPAIIARYAYETECIAEPNGSEIFRHPKHEFIACTPDAWIIDQVGDDHGLLEVKNTTKFISEANPTHYVQLQYQLGCTGANWGVLCYLVQGFKLVHFRFERNEEVIRNAITAGVHFWQTHVVPRVPPKPRLPGDTVRLHSTHKDGTRVIADDECIAYFNSAHGLKREIDALQKQYDLACEQVKAFMGSAEILVAQGDGDGRSKLLATFKTDKRGSRKYLPKYDDGATLE
jgi:putative phage-type endonuclease